MKDKIENAYAYIDKQEFDRLVEMVTRGSYTNKAFQRFDKNPIQFYGHTFYHLSYRTHNGVGILYNFAEHYAIYQHTDAHLRKEREYEERQLLRELRKVGEKIGYEEFDENAFYNALWSIRSIDDLTIEKDEENPLNAEKLALIKANMEPATISNAEELYKKRISLNLKGWRNPFYVLTNDVYMKGMYLKKGTSLQLSYDCNGKLIGLQARKNDCDLIYIGKDGKEHTTSKNYIVFTTKDCGWFNMTPNELKGRDIRTLVIAEGAFTAEGLKRGLQLDQDTTLCYALHGNNFSDAHAVYLKSYIQKYLPNVERVLYYREYAKADSLKAKLLQTARNVANFCKTYMPNAEVYMVNLNDALSAYVDDEKGLDADDIWNRGKQEWFNLYLEYAKMNNGGVVDNVVNLVSACGSGKSNVAFPSLAKAIENTYNRQILYVSKTRRICAEVALTCVSKFGIKATDIALVQDAQDEDKEKDIYKQLQLHGIDPVKRCEANYSRSVIFITEASLFLHIANRDNCPNGGDELIRQLQRTNAIVVWDERPNSWYINRELPIYDDRFGNTHHANISTPIYNYFRIIYMDGTGDLTYNQFKTAYTFKDCLYTFGEYGLAQNMKQDVNTDRTNSNYIINAYKCEKLTKGNPLNDALKVSLFSGRFSTDKELVLVVRKAYLKALQERFKDARYICINDVDGTADSEDILAKLNQRLQEQFAKGVGADTIKETLKKIESANAKYQFTPIDVTLEKDVEDKLKEWEAKGKLIVTSLGYNSGTNYFAEYTQMISVGDVFTSFFQNVNNADTIAQHIQDMTRIGRTGEQSYIDIHTECLSQLMFALEVPKLNLGNDVLYSGNLRAFADKVNKMIEDVSITREKRRTFKAKVKYHDLIKDKTTLCTEDVLNYLIGVVDKTRCDRFLAKYGNIIPDASLLYGVLKQADKGKFKFLSSVLAFVLRYDLKCDWNDISNNIDDVRKVFDGDNHRDRKRIYDLLKKSVNPIINRGDYTEYRRTATIKVEEVNPALTIVAVDNNVYCTVSTTTEAKPSIKTNNNNMTMEWYEQTDYDNIPF